MTIIQFLGEAGVSFKKKQLLLAVATQKQTAGFIIQNVSAEDFIAGFCLSGFLFVALNLAFLSICQV